MLLVVLFFFLFAVASDWLTLAWHRAREGRQVGRTVALSAALEAITWSPILAAITADTKIVWACAGASIVGASIGTRIGLTRKNG